MYCRTARLTVSNRADAHSSVAAADSNVFVKQLRLESSSSQQGVEQIEQRWSGRGKILLLATSGHHVSMFCKLWVKFIVDLHQFTQLILFNLPAAVTPSRQARSGAAGTNSPTKQSKMA
jgi:hypothetical protein